MPVMLHDTRIWLELQGQTAPATSVSGAPVAAAASFWLSWECSTGASATMTMSTPCITSCTNLHRQVLSLQVHRLLQAAGAARRIGRGCADVCG